MTPARQPHPQRYCITQYQIDFIRNAAFTDREKCAKILSEVEDEPCDCATHTSPPATEPFATKMKTDDSHVCYPNCVKFETKRCPYPGSSVRRDTCNCFRSNEDDHYIQSLVFGVYNYPKEIERIVKEHDASVAKAERVRVLDDILRFTEVYEHFMKCDDNGFEIYGVKSANLRDHIEFLRIQQESTTAKEV